MRRLSFDGAVMSRQLGNTLSKREDQVLECILEGDSNLVIGEKLGITEDTVKRHISNIFDRTGMSSRLELAIQFFHRREAKLIRALETVEKHGLLTQAGLPPLADLLDNPLMESLTPSLYLDLIGKPFAEGARGPAAYDCVGLAIEMQRRRGIALPAYLSEPAELHRQLAAGGAFDEPLRLDQPEPGCVVLLRTGSAQRHLGTMIDRFRMLHTMASLAGGSVIERVYSPQWEKLILGFYRVEPTA